MSKMKWCGTCGEEIASSAKVCPKCGAKNKPPIYKRGWFIAIVVVFLLGMISSMGKTGDNHSELEEEEIVYTAYTVDQLVEDLDNNAASAASKYKGQYVELTGQLSVIDSDGKYIAIKPSNDKWFIWDVQCFVTSEDQKNMILTLKRDQKILVRGKITDVGELLGYHLDIDSIESV